MFTIASEKIVMNDYLLLHTKLWKLTKLYIKAEEAQQ